MGFFYCYFSTVSVEVDKNFDPISISQPRSCGPNECKVYITQCNTNITSD